MIPKNCSKCGQVYPEEIFRLIKIHERRKYLGSLMRLKGIANGKKPGNKKRVSSEEIWQLYSNGKSVKEIAAAYQYHIQHVYRILSKFKKEGKHFLPY